MRITIIIFICCVLSIHSNYGQALNLVQWNFDDQTLNVTNPDPYNDNLDATPLLINGFDEVSNLAYLPVSMNVYALSINGWDGCETALCNFESQGKFLEFIIDAKNGRTVSIDRVFVRVKSNGTQMQPPPNRITIRYSFDNTAPPWIELDVPVIISSSYDIKILDIPNIVKSDKSIRFQITAWRQEIGGAAATATVDIDYITFSPTSTLPIELTTFTATPIPTGIALKWSTASEINNAYVAVERSTDGSRYDEIGRVPGQGDSFEPRDYNYTDESPEKGVNYYRLRQVDYDGAENFSPVVQATFGKTGKLSVYPSPATERLNVTLTETEGDPVRWEVYDVSGRLTLSGTQESDTVSFPIELGNLPEGVYTVQVFVGREVMTERFVKK